MADPEEGAPKEVVDSGTTAQPGSGFTELGSDIVGGVIAGARGPLANLLNQNKLGSDPPLSYPLDVEGVGERHFIRFGIVTKEPPKIGDKEKNTDIPTESRSGEFLGGLASTAARDAIGDSLGPLGGFAGGIIGDVAGSVVDLTGAGELLDGGIDSAVGLAGAAVGGALELGAEIVGGVADAAAGAAAFIAEGFVGIAPASVQEKYAQKYASEGELKNTIQKEIPVSKDNIKNTLLSFSPFSPESGYNVKKADIIMYMPVGIQETYSNQWDRGDAGFARTALESYEGAKFDSLEAIEKMLKEVGKFSSNYLKESAGRYAGQQVGIQDLDKYALKRFANETAVQPQYELYFNRPNPRTFTFDFKMIPKNKQEAKQIQAIIHTFRKYSAPFYEGNETSRYYKYPSLFNIEFWNADKLFKIYPCALENITVNYTGTGTPGTHRDGRPIQTDMTLTFVESKLITRADIENGY